MFNTIKSKFFLFFKDLSSYLESISFISKIKSDSGKLHPSVEKHFFKIAAVILIIIFVALVYIFSWRAPRPFPDHILVTIERGESLSQIAESFGKNNVVRSSFWLRVAVGLLGGERNVIAGDYYFPSAANVFGVASTITAGQFGLSPIKVVVPEGLNSTEVANLLNNSLPRFDRTGFAGEAKENEGYLFPDTYFFMPNAKPSEIIAIMRENFARQVNNLEPDITKFGKPMEDVITMASIVENEARTIETRRIIAGILWKRLKKDIPLQADATFKYTLSKTTFDLTKDDLEDKDNPYNTYANKGLPPTPISNPGLDSIRATIAPTNTDYLFFLSDKNGTMHYAVNFEQHKRNRELYLSN